MMKLEIQGDHSTIELVLFTATYQWAVKGVRCYNLDIIIIKAHSTL